MPRTPQRQGIETRTGPRGDRHRAYVRKPGGGLKRGPWRDSLAEARGDRTKLLGAKDAGTLVERPAMPTVREAGAAWLALAVDGRAWTRSGDPYAPATLRGYADSFRLHVYPAIGDLPIDLVRRSHVQGLVDEVAALHSGQTARNAATPLQALYRYLLARHDDLADPTHGVQLPRGSKPRERIATPDELQALVGALAPADRAALVLAGMVGLRRGEMRALHAEAVVLDRESALARFGAAVNAYGWVHVAAGFDRVEGRKDPKSEAGGRIVPILAPALPFVEAQAASLGPSPDPLSPFLPARGRWGEMIGAGRPFDPQEWLKRAYRTWDAAKLARLGLHEARHSFASHLIAAGFDVATVAEWVGHARASFTLDRYVKPLRSKGIDRAAVAAYLGVTA